MVKKISIIIPVFNRYVSLELTLESIFNSSYRDFEVIIVDDASTDERLSSLKETFDIKYIKLPNKMGPAAARNRGISTAQGEILFFTDSDVVLLKHTLDECVRFFSEYPERKCVMGIFLKEPINKGFGPEYKALWDWFVIENHKKNTVSELDTALCAIKREMIDKLPKFDENYNNANIEDNVYGYEIQKSCPIYLNTRMIFKHRFPGLF